MKLDEDENEEKPDETQVSTKLASTRLFTTVINDSMI